MRDHQGWSPVTLCTFTSAAEAHLARMVLEAEGIPAIVLDEVMSAITSAPIALGVRLQVPAVDEVRAREILASRAGPGRPESLLEELAAEPLALPGSIDLEAYELTWTHDVLEVAFLHEERPPLLLGQITPFEVELRRVQRAAVPTWWQRVWGRRTTRVPALQAEVRPLDGPAIAMSAAADLPVLAGLRDSLAPAGEGVSLHDLRDLIVTAQALGAPIRTRD